MLRDVSAMAVLTVKEAREISIVFRFAQLNIILSV